MDPLPDSPAGGVIAGAVRAGDAGVADATVRLEPVVDGIAVSVAEKIAEVAGRTVGVPAGTAEETGAGIRVTISDSHGRYAFDGLESGNYLIVSQAEDHLAGSALAVIPRDLAAAAGTTFVDINLMPTGTFTGNATLQNMTDHSSTVVYVTGSSNVAVTNSTGDYALTGVPVGDHVIQATHTGWLDQSTGGTLTTAGEFYELSSLVLPREANMPPTVEILPLVEIPAQTIFESIAFEATATDPDGTIELVEWDFQDDGFFDVSGPAAYTPSWAIADAGSYRVKVRVTDDKGAIGLAVLNYDVYDAIYVSGVGGDDYDPGTKAKPVQTIQQGITLAEPKGRPVIVNIGSYWEEVEFKSNVSVWGGYDREAGWTKTPGNYSEVWLQSFYNHTATASSVTHATIRGLEIEAETAQGDGTSAIALILTSCDSTLIFNDCRIIAGNATAALTAGAHGTTGIAGGAGGAGGNGCDANQSGCGIGEGGVGGTGAATGGDGGRAGYGLTAYETFLVDGEAGLGSAGGLGGASVFGCLNTASNGNNATANGLNGNDGQSAIPIGTSYGYITGSDWIGELGAPGKSGQNGQPGSGGGGGGGVYHWLDGCSLYGASGGGGGGSGGGGGGGVGGNHGGASIAVLCIGSTPVFDSCLIQTGNGGPGWRGGDGGIGGLGGVYGSGGTGYSLAGGRSGDGGNGSTGGSGGDGSGGQGGPGGPSIGIYNFNGSTPTLISLTWSIGSGGAGGPGGTHGSGSPVAATGPAGPSAQTYNHP